ncbi:hypothetical protein [Pseudomonas aeruginosa]|uniref:hypothetical protein n=1 Tax=Pseudomonas aeruginosa TaxID=287 RepID=UPI00071C0994|nr:hypothetical protein [Pseudomonas aeruginosa]KSB98967.1 hypothetical protein AO879_16225 [Pseudomonas aeruginosa]HBN9861138.1 hypothetical protein [Pseudomonas aeruginosa]HBN9886214.1 hypothetical protein [Pseudomonas aeruginosa]
MNEKEQGIFSIGSPVPFSGKGKSPIADAHAEAARTLAAVFTQVARCLEGHDLALETLDAYKADAAAGLLTVDRLRGFLQGLSAAGALPYEDYCEVDAALA